jgi:hypothetical protein
MGVRQFWRTLSVSRKLYSVIGGMALLICLQLFTLAFAMKTISSVRAIVTGESLWSKAQKDAVLSLHKYARTQNPIWYDEFKQNLRIPLGDSEGRKALEQDPPDLENTKKGFLEGKNHPDDIEKLIYLLRTFNKVPQVRAALDLWTEGDQLNAKLAIKAEELHQSILNKTEESNIASILMEVDNINQELTIKERGFALDGKAFDDRTFLCGADSGMHRGLPDLFTGQKYHSQFARAHSSGI